MRNYNILSLLVLSVFTLMIVCQSVSAYPILKTYNKEYNLVSIGIGTAGLVDVPFSSIIVYINASEYNFGDNIKLCKYLSSTTWTCADTYKYSETILNSKKNGILNITIPLSSYLSFKVVLNDVEDITGGSFMRLRQINPATIASRINCLNNCSNRGILTYSLVYVFSPDTCSNYFIGYTPTEACPDTTLVQATRPSIKSTSGITVQSSGERIITTKTKIYEISCEGTGQLLINMDGYATSGYDVYHNGQFVENSNEATYNITSCSKWVFDKLGYISECRGTKTTVFAALILLSIIIIIVAAKFLIDSDGLSTEAILGIIAFGIVLFVAFFVTNEISTAVCGV